MKTGEEHFKDYKEYLEQNKMQGAGLSLMAAAFSNYAPAQAILGRYHLLGEVFPKDLPNALKWLEKAVEQDYAPAMTSLAAMYMFGDGVKVNGKKAVELLKYTPAKGLVDFNRVLDEMWVVAQQEMNFLTEAQNLERFSALNADVACSGMK